MKDLENAHRIKSEEFRNMLLQIPNLPHDSVPIGKNSDQNVIYMLSTRPTYWGETAQQENNQIPQSPSLKSNN